LRKSEILYIIPVNTAAVELLVGSPSTPLFFLSDDSGAGFVENDGVLAVTVDADRSPIPGSPPPVLRKACLDGKGSHLFIP